MNVHATCSYPYIVGILQLCHMLVPAPHSVLQAHALLMSLHAGISHRVPKMLQLERGTAAKVAVRACGS